MLIAVAGPPPPGGRTATPSSLSGSTGTSEPSAAIAHAARRDSATRALQGHGYRAAPDRSPTRARIVWSGPARCARLRVRGPRNELRADGSAISRPTIGRLKAFQTAASYNHPSGKCSFTRGLITATTNGAGMHRS